MLLEPSTGLGRRSQVGFKVQLKVLGVLGVSLSSAKCYLLWANSLFCAVFCTVLFEVFISFYVFFGRALQESIPGYVDILDFFMMNVAHPLAELSHCYDYSPQVRLSN